MGRWKTASLTPKKYIRDYEYKGELIRICAGRYEYILDGKKYHIHSELWVLYGSWIVRSGGEFYERANTLSTVVRNIDRNSK